MKLTCLSTVKRILFLSFSICYFSTPNLSQSTIKLIFAGDIMCHEAQISSSFDSLTNSYSFNGYFDEIEPMIQSADLALANLETTLSVDDYSGYPTFRSPDRLAESLRKTGFKLLFTANNHSLDNGTEGVYRTIRVLNHLGLLHTGSFMSAEERELLSPLVITASNIKIGFLNYTYGVNSQNSFDSFLINTIDTVGMLNDIQKANKKGCDILIAYLHWGPEYQAEPAGSQEWIASWLKKRGVRLIIGSHPHVTQPVIYDKTGNTINSVTAYSLGNLISNQREGDKKKGLLLEVCLSKSKQITYIDKVIEHPTYVSRKPTHKGYSYLITLPSSHAPI